MDLAKDRNACKSFTRNCPTHVSIKSRWYKKYDDDDDDDEDADDDDDCFEKKYLLFFYNK